jgi:hypothetical protein
MMKFGTTLALTDYVALKAPHYPTVCERLPAHLHLSVK